MSGRRHRLNSFLTAGLFVLLGAAPAIGQTAREVEDVFWRDVVCERELEVRAYLKTYPNGVYVNEARACLERGLGLTRAERIRVQAGLQAAGQEPGPADGLFGGLGAKTRQAIQAWQAAKGLAVTGYVTQEQAETLMALGEDAEETRRAAAARAAQEEAARQAAAADDAAYAAAEGADTAAAYGEYLEAYPAGRHAAAARERQAERQAAAEQAAREEAARQAAAADDAAYVTAEEVDTAAAYGEYMKAYPAGRHADAAREAREAARRAEAERVAQRRARDAALRVGQTFRDALRSGGEGPEMVVVPAGTFRMGCVSGQDCQDDEYPVHRVMIGAPFAVGVYEGDVRGVGYVCQGRGVPVQQLG